MSAGRAAQVIVLPVDSERCVVIQEVRQGTGRRQKRSGPSGQWLGGLSPLLMAAAGGARSNVRLYELSPESQQMLKTLKRNEVGGYFRGVLRSDNGKTAHQIQLKPADGRTTPTSPALGPLDAAMFAQLAVIQVQLDRIEQALQDIALDVKAVLSFLEREQRAEIAAALEIASEIHRRMRAAGVVTSADWTRLAAVELALRKQHRQVLAELLDRLTKPSWNGNPKDDASAMREVDPARVAELLDLLRLLAGALWRWEEISAVHQLSTGAIAAGDAEAQQVRLAVLEQQYNDVLAAISTVTERASLTRPRSNWSRLWSDGIVIGEKNDNSNLAKIASGRRALQTAVAPGATTAAVTSRPRLALTAA